MDSPTRMRVRVGTVSSFLAVLLLVMSELSRLTGEVLDTRGRSFSANDLMGVGSPSREGWLAAFTGDLGGARTTWLTAYLVVDIVFILTYVWAAWTAKLTSWNSLAIAITVVGAFDMVEDVAAFVAVRGSSPPAGWLTWLLWIATMLKTTALLASGVVVMTRWRTNATYRAAVRRWCRATYRHRFSVLAILPIAVLGVLPGNDLLDQLPDVQRRWLLDGWGHAAAAAVAMTLVAAGLLLLGRLRTTTAWNPPTAGPADGKRAHLRLAAIAPALAVTGWVIMVARGSATLTNAPGLVWWPLAIFVGVPVAIALLSLWIRVRQASSATTGSPWFPKPVFTPLDLSFKEIVLRTGDVVATTALVIGGLGLVRSFTAVIALGATVSGTSLGWAVIAWVVGAGGAVAAWPLMRAVTDFLTWSPGDPVLGEGVLNRLRRTMSPSVTTTASPVVRLGVLAAGIGLLLVIGLEPEWFARHVGVIATATSALLAACLVIGGIVVVLEQRLSPEVFWFAPIKSPSVPVTTVIVVAIALTSTLGDDADIHGLQGLVKPPAVGRAVAQVPERPDVAQAFRNWVGATSGCGQTRSVGGRTVTLRPMFLVAAEGGGIRAAYWSAAAMDLLSGAAAVTESGVDWQAGDPSACSRPLLAGGASGGAVGLTVARFAGGSSARDRVVTMSAPDALGQATAGLFVRDLLYAVTGLPVFGRPSWEVADASQPVWRDRGALMEKVWADDAGLSGPFLPADQADASRSRTGALVLNSTRVSDGCRMWVSQLSLGSGPGAECDASSAPAGHTLDLIDLMSPVAAGGDGGEDDLCLGPMTAATGAMLASRFPFVTPSGVAGPCGGQIGQQFVDGGYVENSGLKTLVDLGPEWLVEVQRHNEEALGTPSPSLIIPIVVYLDNGTGTDLRVEPPQRTPELLVPQRTSSRAASSLVDTPALLREAERLVSSGSVLPGGADLQQLRDAVEDWRHHAAFVVHQSTVPAVTAPLGWVLSQQSIETMDRALLRQATTSADGSGSSRPAASSPILSGRGSLADALALMTPPG